MPHVLVDVRAAASCTLRHMRTGAVTPRSLRYALTAHSTSSCLSARSPRLVAVWILLKLSLSVETDGPGKGHAQRGTTGRMRSGCLEDAKHIKLVFRHR